MNKRLLIAALVATAIALTPAHAQEASPAGDWIGEVSWSDPPVTYSWYIAPNHTFSSDRAGRPHRGGGAWTLDGATLTLKYGNGFRYEGQLNGDAYSGQAYRTDGSALGAFSMSRVHKRLDDGAVAEEEGG